MRMVKTPLTYQMVRTTPSLKRRKGATQVQVEMRSHNPENIELLVKWAARLNGIYKYKRWGVACARSCAV